MMKKLPKLFIDTNVWFSYFYSSENCEKIIRAHIDNRVKAVVSQQVLVEIVRNLQEKIPQTLSLFETFIEHSPPIVVKDSKQIDIKVKEYVSREGQIIFMSAYEADVDIFVTGNISDFDTKNIIKYYSLPVLSPKEVVDRLGL